MYEKAGSTQRSKNSPLGARPIGYLSPKLSPSWGNIIFISLSPRYEAGRKGAGPPTHILPGSLQNFCSTIRTQTPRSSESDCDLTILRCIQRCAIPSSASPCPFLAVFWVLRQIRRNFMPPSGSQRRLDVPQLMRPSSFRLDLSRDSSCLRSNSLPQS